MGDVNEAKVIIFRPFPRLHKEFSTATTPLRERLSALAFIHAFSEIVAASLTVTYRQVDLCTAMVVIFLATINPCLRRGSWLRSANSVLRREDF